MTVLGDEEVAAALARLPGWQQDGAAIRRDYSFDSYGAVMRFVARLADLADAANHHPDLEVGHHGVVVRLTTHRSGGVTRHDLDFAGRIDCPEPPANA